jgi:ligand-binding sensor domain-containing protein
MTARLILALLCLGLTASAARAERLPIKTYTTADGLAHDRVNRIVRDSRGFLWFCTDDGLSRFDGYTFTNFSTDDGLPHSSITDFLESRGGDFWVGTRGGLAQFNPRGARGASMFVAVGTDGQQGRRTQINVLRETQDGTIWAGTTEGLYRVELAGGRRSLRRVDIGLLDDYAEERIVEDVQEDPGGSLWIATPRGLYRRKPDGSAARYTMEDGLPHNFLSALRLDREGRLWVGSRLSGAFRLILDPSGGPPRIDATVTQRDGLQTAWISGFFEAANERFWILTARELLQFSQLPHGTGHPFVLFGRENGFTDYELTAINEDLNGNLWIGTSRGAMKLTRNGFTAYGEADGLRTVNTVFEDRAGNVCFRGNVLGDARTSVFEGAKLDFLSAQRPAMHIRLGCLKSGQFEWFKPAAVGYLGWVTEGATLQARTGEWWVGTGEGVYRFPASDEFSRIKTARPLAVYATEAGLAALQVYRLFEDSRGNVWISASSATVMALARWEPGDEALHDMARSPGLAALKDGWAARSFAEDRAGNVWIGFDSELARYSGGGFTLFTNREGLPRGAIRHIFVDSEGRVWFASAQSGLVLVGNPTGARPTFTSYTTANGLSANSAEVIAEDREGHIYVAGGRGIDRLDPTTARVKHFTSADGVAPGLFRAAFRDRTGALWFGTTAGLTRLVPIKEEPAQSPPVRIHGLRVAGVSQLMSALGEREMALADLPPHRNQLEIDVRGLSFRSGEVLQYQYKLDGAQADWSPPTAQRTMTYATLAPGRYTFMARAVNSDGGTSARPAAVTFRVLAPVWRRWWFLTLLAGALVLPAVFVHRYRLARVLEMANMRTRIATDLHDDIGANLTRIALLSEVARRTYRDNRTATEAQPGGSPDTPDGNGPLNSIANIARESISSMSDIVWAINPQRESLLDLTRRMRQHAEEVFTLRDIELCFAVPGGADSMKLSVDVRRDLLLVFKEAVNNAARHSGCSRVEIDLRFEGPGLMLRIVDNGAAGHAAFENEGNGLPSMRRRAQRLKGSLEIGPGAGAGTAVTLRIPL